MNDKEEKRASIERAMSYHIMIRDTNNRLNAKHYNPYYAGLVEQAQAALDRLQKELDSLG